MKKACCCILIVILSVYCSEYCFASGLSTHKVSYSSEEELTEIEELLQISDEQLKNALQCINPSVDCNRFEFNMDNLLKIYSFNNPDIVSAFHKTKTLKDAFSEDYIWSLSLREEGINILFAQEETDGTWHIMGANDSLNRLKAVSTNIVFSTEDMRKRIPYQDIENLCYARSHMYHTDFVYFTHQQKEYVIPFGTRPDLTGLQNEQIYEVESAMDILEKQFGKFDLDKDNQLSGGGVKGSLIYSPILWFSSLSLLAILVTYIVIKAKKAK